MAESLPQAALEALVDGTKMSGIGLIVGICASSLCLGGLFVQVPRYASSATRAPLGRIQLATLGLILALTLACISLNFVRIVAFFVLNFNNAQYLISAFRDPVQATEPFLANVLVALCQLFLVHRSYLFGANLLDGTHRKIRAGFLAFLGVLALVGCAAGLTANIMIRRFSSILEFSVADFRHRPTPFLIAQTAWICISLAVDAFLTGLITKDLFGAIVYSRNDVGVGRSLRSVLSRLLQLTIANGTVLVGLQITLLVAFLRTKTGWAVGALAALPGLQCVSLFTYLCAPIESRARQALMSSQDGDEELANSPAAAMPLANRPTLARTAAQQRKRRRRQGGSSGGTLQSLSVRSILHRPSLSQHRPAVGIIPLTQRRDSQLAFADAGKG